VTNQAVPWCRPGNVYDETCPSRTVWQHLTSRWVLLVLLRLQRRPYRFSQLARGIGGISEHRLWAALRMLMSDGFVQRVVYPTVPPSTVYDLTPLGWDVAAHARDLVEWVEEHAHRVAPPRGPRS
jgi:DNA-binding HxlR family transcriptional regulator